MTITNKVQPGLAKSWDISNDGTTYTFHLNENMNFSNGDIHPIQRVLGVDGAIV